MTRQNPTPPGSRPSQQPTQNQPMRTNTSNLTAVMEDFQGVSIKVPNSNNQKK